MIRAEGVCKSFDKKEVLTDIDAVFEPGKVNLIIGKSGSGKTVLLKSLIGLHSIDKGKIFYNDRDITVMNNKQIKEIRKELGVVFQGGALFGFTFRVGEREVPVKSVFFDDGKGENGASYFLPQPGEPE